MGAVETVDGFKGNFVFAQAGILQGFVGSRPARPSRFCPSSQTSRFGAPSRKFGPGIGLQEDLDAEHIQLLCVAKMVTSIVSFVSSWKAEDESAMDNDAGFTTGARESPQLHRAESPFDSVEDFLIATLVTDQKQAQTGIFEKFDCVVFEIGAAVA